MAKRHIEKNILNYSIIGYIIIAIVGTLLHYLYDWTGENLIVGFFSAVSESIWEHMKLLFFPAVAYGFYFTTILSKQYPCIEPAYFLSVIISTFSIPVLFYVYTGILGKSYAFFDILIFFIAILILFFLTYGLSRNRKLCKYLMLIRRLILVLIVAFMVFSYLTPKFGIFVE